jgi:hypothetical protein
MWHYGESGGVQILLAFVIAEILSLFTAFILRCCVNPDGNYGELHSDLCCIQP